jgi:hypothetical protein
VTRWILWPSALPERLVSLAAGLTGARGPFHDVDSLTDAGIGAGPDVDTVVLVMVGDAGDAHSVEWLTGVDPVAYLDIVVITGDGYLGTAVPDRARAVAGAAAVAAARSLAATRGGNVRANVVCAPEGLWGAAGDHRGPLAQPAEVEDIVQAAAFLMDGENEYLNGQVLFVDGGRHLFSSHTA